MRHLNDRGSVVVEPLKQIHDHFSLARVQAAGGFVGENQLGLSNHGAGNGDELLLSAGELVRIQRFLADDLEAVKNIRHHPFAFGLLNIAVGKRQIEIFRDSEIIEQVILLEDEADVFFVQLDAAAIVKLVDRIV